MLVDRNSPIEIRRQRPRQRLHPGILEKVNQPAQRTFVYSEAGRMIEPTQARTARRANSLLVERPRVKKGRIANRAEVIGIQGRGRSQTVGTDRNPGPFEQRAIANAAVVGEKQRKNSVRDPANEIEGSRSRYSTTREGAPPCIWPTTRLLRSEIS
jgi:hypothetical protein